LPYEKTYDPNFTVFRPRHDVVELVRLGQTCSLDHDHDDNARNGRDAADDPADYDDPGQHELLKETERRF
jgi:hypothetical protein